MAAAGADDMGGLPQRGLDRAAISSLTFPPITVGRVQQPSATRLFHHRVHCRAHVHHHRLHAKPGDFQPTGLGRPGGEPAAARSIHFLALWWFLLFILAHVTLVFMTGRAGQPEHDVGRR